MFDAIRAVRLADKGHMPCAGGWINQSATFIDAMFRIEGDERKLLQDRQAHPFARQD